MMDEAFSNLIETAGIASPLEERVMNLSRREIVTHFFGGAWEQSPFIEVDAEHEANRYYCDEEPIVLVPGDERGKPTALCRMAHRYGDLVDSHRQSFTIDSWIALLNNTLGATGLEQDPCRILIDAATDPASEEPLLLLEDDEGERLCRSSVAEAVAALEVIDTFWAGYHLNEDTAKAALKRIAGRDDIIKTEAAEVTS